VAETNTGISVGRTNGDVHVRVAGRGTFQNGQPLRRYALDMINQGVRQFVVDLGPCEGMDSTFLGVLAGIGLQLREPATRGHLCLANVSPRNLESLQTLGLDRLFKLAPATGAAPAVIPWQWLPDPTSSQFRASDTKKDAANVMLEAHDNLIRADNRNQTKFKDLTTILRARTDKDADKKTS